jgi:hypothetical protein
MGQAWFYETKEQANKAAQHQIDTAGLNGVLRPSAVVQTVILNQIHASKYADDSRRVFMLVWPEAADLQPYIDEAKSRQEAMKAKYDALMAQAEAVKAQMSGVSQPTPVSEVSETQVFAAESHLEVKPSENGQFSVMQKPSAW